MALETKKFLDYSGTSHLWSKIKVELDKKGALDTLAAADNSITVAGTTTARTVAVKISNKAGNTLSIETTSGSEGLYVPTPTSSSVYSVVKDTTAAEGYAATYHLTKDGVNEGAAINIPKDMVVSGGEVKTVVTADSPYTGAAVGDKYIEITLANNDGTKLYIPANSLVEYVTGAAAADGIITVSIDSSTHIATATIADGSIPASKLASAVQTSLNNADSALQASDIAEGSTNGTISIDGSDVAVHGLGSAAFASSTDFDASGAADDVYAAIIALTNNEIDAAIAAATPSQGS